MDAIFIMGHPCEQQTQDANLQGLVAYLPQHDPQGGKGKPGGPDLGGTDHGFQQVGTFRHLLGRQAADELPQKRGDVLADGVLAALQFPDQVDDDLIALVRPQHGGQFHQGLASPFPDRKMLADGKQVGKMGGNMEGFLAMGFGIAGQYIHVGKLYRPMHCFF